MSRSDTRCGVCTGALLMVGALVLLAVLALPLFLGEVYTEDDLSAFHLPLRSFYHDALHNGHAFLWMPHLFNGFYVHGEGQAGMLHPLHWLFYRSFSLPTAFMLEFWLSYPLLFAGLWLFLRRWGVPTQASLFGALLGTFAGFPVNHYIHMHFVAVLTHLPWSLLLINVAMRERRAGRVAWAVLGVVALGASQLLTGIPQATFFTWLTEMLYALYLLGVTRNYRVLLLLGAAKLLAMMVAAAQLLPTAEALSLSTRADPDQAYLNAIALRPQNWLQFLSPYLFERRVYGSVAGDEPWDAPYFGAATPVLLLFLVLQWRHWGRWRGLVLCGFFLVVLGALSSLGRYGFLHPIYGAIPLVDKLRAPARFVALVHFGLALLTAVSFAQLLNVARKEPWASWRRMLLLAAVPAASAIVTAGAWAVKQGWFPIGPDWAAANIMPPVPLLTGFLFVATASALVILAARGHPWAFVPLVLLVLVDVSLYSLRHKPAQPVPEVAAGLRPPALAPGQRIEPDVYPATMNLVALQDLRAPSGYVALFPQRRLDFSQDLPLRMAGVAWREVRVGTNAALNAAHARGMDWLPLKDPLPRARLLSASRVSDAPNEDVYRWPPETVALLEQALDLPPGTPGTAAIQRDAPGRIEVETESDTPQLLVVSESYHPGWRVSVDENAGETLRTFGEFLGVVVPEGRHQVAFTFRPESFTRGRWVSLLGLLLCAPLWFTTYLLVRRSKSRGGGQDAAMV